MALTQQEYHSANHYGNAENQTAEKEIDGDDVTAFFGRVGDGSREGSVQGDARPAEGCYQCRSDQR